MEPFRSFKLLEQPHTVTQGFVLFQMDRNIIVIYLGTKKATNTSVGLCVIVG